MSVRVSMKVIGLDKVRRHIGKDAVQKAIDDSLNEVLRGALKIERTAKKLAPVAFGDLRASITHTGLILVAKRVLGVIVGTAKRTAKFLEFGTGPEGAKSVSIIPKSGLEYMQATGYQWGGHGGWVPEDAITAWMKRKGIELEFLGVIQRKIWEMGTKAQPFLFPAFEKHKGEIADDITRALRKVLEKGR